LAQIRSPVPLVVDLNGGLLRSSLTEEAFWSAFAHDLLFPLKTLRRIGTQESSIREILLDKSRFDLNTLPVDTKVVKYIKDWRENGGHTVLVTADCQQQCEGFATRLGIFDEVLCPKAHQVMSNRVTANFLLERYGENGFDYVGDDNTDRQIWAMARNVCTVNASLSLRTWMKGFAKPVEHLVTRESSWRPYFTCLRSYQWLKNLLVFVPMIAAHRFDSMTFISSLTAFIGFCCTASSAYLFNDLLDLSADRAHPRKSSRPIASAQIPLTHASVMGSGLLAAGFLCSIFLGWSFTLTMMAYYVGTVSYSVYFKRLVIIDICALAALYTVRILAGSLATGIELTVWMVAFSLFLFFSLAAVKRQAELVDVHNRGELNSAGRGYRVVDLPIITNMALSAGYLSALVLALYINSPGVALLYSRPSLLFGVCCILLYWISWMVVVAHRGMMHDDPIVFVMKDRVSQMCIAVAAGLAAAGTLT
jgi:4-hydroxybenzoate polyprenyltransferase